MFFESLAECSHGFTNVCVAVVDVTRDVIDGSTLVFFWCFVTPVADGPKCRTHRHVFAPK